jgi:peptide/nickel transport system permease protein
MRAYVLRRLMIMIPTFIGINLLVFVVLNLAPGRPDALGAEAGVALEAGGEASDESYRLFHEQFSLDKPILLNTRFWLSTEEVRRDLMVVATLVPASIAQRIDSRERLMDLGNYAVPHLIAVTSDADAAGQTALRDTAAYFLRLCAPRQKLDPFDPSPSPEQRAHNDAVEAERTLLRPLRYAFDAPESEKRAVLRAWMSWYTAVKDRFEHDGLTRLRLFFLDTRFATYWQNLIQLDFGVSLTTRQPVIGTLISKLKYSLALTFLALVLAYAIAIPLGVLSSARRDTPMDRRMTVALFMLHSLPSFFVASLLLYFFSEGSNWPALRIFPTGGFQSLEHEDLTTFGKVGDILWHLVLPVGCLTYGSLAALSRYMRTGLLEVLGSDYVRTARAKGLPERLVIGKHALRNGLLPIVTLLGTYLPGALGGSVVIEYIFGIPGIGLWTINSIHQRDYNVIMGVQLVTTVFVLFAMLVTDIGYALIDPRIRYR